MKNMLFVLCVPLVLIFTPSCVVNRQFASAINDAWQVIGPEYKTYVQQDEKLDQLQKNIRIQTADQLTVLLQEAINEQPQTRN